MQQLFGDCSVVLVQFLDDVSHHWIGVVHQSIGSDVDIVVQKVFQVVNFQILQTK